MIETKKDKIKDYIIAILLIIIAILIGIIYSKVLMEKNTNDINSAAEQTRKSVTDYFKGLEENGYVLTDLSQNANFDYYLGKVNLFNKDYKLSIKNNYNECEEECKYMYKIYINEKEAYTTSFLKGIKIGIIGNYVAIEEIYGNSNYKLLLIQANTKEIVKTYKFNGELNIKYENNIYNINIKEENCNELSYSNTTIIYNKEENTFTETRIPTGEALNEINNCTN